MLVERRGVDLEPVPAGGVRDELAGLPRARSPTARPRGRPSASSGTARRTSSACRTTSSGASDRCAGQQPGCARSRDSSLTPETATTRWPTRWSAAPRTAPTRPAPTTPTSRRAGRSSAEVTAPNLSPGSWCRRTRLHGARRPHDVGDRLGAVTRPSTWQAAWQEALYGPDGFYRSAAGPAGHFSTATHGALGAVLAGASRGWPARTASPTSSTSAPGAASSSDTCMPRTPALRLTGVDVVARPQDARRRRSTGWSPPAEPHLPDELRHLDRRARRRARVARRRAVPRRPGRRRRRPAPGAGRPGHGRGVASATRSTGPDLDWATAHWPTDSPASASRSGSPATAPGPTSWRGSTRGVVVAVDYGHRGGDRPAAGTLAAYRRGQLVTPVPDGTLRPDRPRRHGHPRPRRAARPARPRCAASGSTVARRPLELARSDPQAYLHALSSSSAAAALAAPGGFGDFLWAVKRVG